MTKLSKREQYLIIAALLFAIVALVAYLYFLPLQNEINSLEMKSNEITASIEEAKNTAILIQTTSEEIEEIEQELAEKREFLMDTIDEPKILKYVTDIIINNGNLSSLNYNEVVDKAIYFSKDVSLSFTTSYTGLKNIVKAFENGDYFTVVPNISINPIEDPVTDVQTTVEETEATTPTLPYTDSQVSVSMTIRFYGKESTWDGSGEYDFMDGDFGKDNIFR